MTKLTRIVEDLRPTKKYIFRARAINAFGQVSDWSEALVYETPGDLSTPNPPSELSTNFDSPDLIVRWRAPGQNTDGSIISDLDHYLITFADPSGRSITYETGQHIFIFTFEMNKQFFGNPQPKLNISIQAVDTSYRRSEAATTSAENLRPDDPAEAPFLVSAFTLINVSMDKGLMSDFKRIALYHSTDGFDFQPLQVPTGDLNYTHAVNQASTHYYKYKLVDVFEQQSINFSPTASTTTLSINEAIVDVDPPSVPTNLQVTDQGFDLETNSWTEFSWTASTDADSSVSFYELQYRKTSDSAFQKILVAGTETDTRIENLKPATPYEARIRAVDIYGNASAYTNLVGFTTEVDTAPPAVPTGMVTTSGIGSIGVSWSPNIELDFDHYKLYGEPNNSGFTPSAANLLYLGNGTGHVLTGLDFNDVWYFRLVAVDDYDNESPPTAEFSESSVVTFVEDTTPPATPANVSITSNVSTNEQITRARIELSWDPNTEEDLAGYEIGYRENGYLPWTTVSVPAGTTSNVLSNLLPSTTYNIRIAAFDTNLNKSPFHQENETTPGDTDPPPTPLNSNQITVLRTILFFWDGVSALDLAGYHVEFATDNTFTNVVYEWTGNSTSVEFQGDPDTTYYMRVRSFDRTGNYSDFSTALSTTTAGAEELDITPPATPTDLTLTTGQEFSGQTENIYVNITWTENTEEDVAGYSIRFYKTGGTTYQYVTVPVGNDSAKITGVQPNTGYSAQIAAYDKSGNYSPFSAAASIVSAVDNTPPPDVTGLTVTPFMKSTNIRWDPVVADDLSHYNVHVGTTSGFVSSENNKFTETLSTSVTVNKYFDGTNWVDMVPGETYYFQVGAVDRSGNVSGIYGSGSGEPDPVDGAIVPSSPTNITFTEVDDVLNVSFNTVVDEPIDTYEVWASYETDGDYGIISDIDNDDILTASPSTVVTVSDQNITSQGTTYYKIYAVHQGVRSIPLTGDYTVIRTVSETGLNFEVQPMATSFILTYEIPDDRMLAYMKITHEARPTATGFNEANSVEVYRGLADTFIYEIESAELEHYHQFWLSAVTRP